MLILLSTHHAQAQEFPPGTLLWHSSFGGYPIYSSPAVGDDGTIYSGVYALKPDGTRKWAFPTGDKVDSSPSVDEEGTIYVGSRDGKLYAVHPDGRQKWFFQTGAGIESSPAIGADGTVYVGSRDRFLYAIHRNGKLKWSFATEDQSVYSPVLGADGSVYVSASSDVYGGNLVSWYALNPDGTPRWKFNGHMNTWLKAAPAIGNDGLIYWGIGNTFFAYHPENGTEAWHYVFESPAGGPNFNGYPVIAPDGKIYAPSDYNNYNICAFSSSSSGLADSSWPMYRHDPKHTGRAVKKAKPTIALTPDVTYEGFIRAWQFAYFSLPTQEDRSFVLEVEPLEGTRSLVVDGKLGALPDYPEGGEYTKTKKTVAGKYRLLISPTVSGTYYFSLFGREIDEAGGLYRITALSRDRALSDVSPVVAGNKGKTTLLVSGIGFTQGMQLQLTGDGLLSLTPENITVLSPKELAARFDLSGAAAGQYKVVVTWPEGSSLELPFRVRSDSVGPKLEAHLESPDDLRPGRTYTLWLEYTNAGDADLPAPLLIVDANCPMSSDDEDITEKQVQALGIGTSALADVLRPGESRRVPIFFIAPEPPEAVFTLSEMQETSDPIPWDSYKEIMQPPDMSDAEWDALWPSLIARLGDTWSEYPQVLRKDALRMRQRGAEASDVRKLIGFEARQAAGEPVAAISGVLRDKDTGELLAGVSLRAAPDNDTIAAETETLYLPEGHFILEDLPDGVYEVFPEGYYFEAPVSVTVSEGKDVNDQVFWGKKISKHEGSPETPEFSDHNPAVATDEAGKLYMVWGHGEEIRWAVRDGNGWGQYGKIDNATGSHPALLYDAALLENGTSPGLLCAWESGLDPKTIQWSVGKPSEEGIVWSEPQLLTGDAYDDYGIALATDSDHRAVVLWLQANLNAKDDTDLYYETFAPESTGLTWTDLLLAAQQDENQASDLLAEIDQTKTCAEFEFGFPPEQFKIPEWIPILGNNDTGIYIYGKQCGYQDCVYDLTGEAYASVYVTGKSCTLTTQGFARWVTMDKKGRPCQYVFSNAHLEGSAALGLEPFSKSFAIEIEEVKLAKAEVSTELNILLSLALTWRNNFPYWPKDGYVSLSANGSVQGRLNVAGDGLVGGVKGKAALWWTVHSPSFKMELLEYCLVLGADLSVAWGTFEEEWEKSWGKCLNSKLSALPSEEDLFFTDNVFTLYQEEEPVEEYRIVKSPFTGTGAVYEGRPVLGDITNNLYNDGYPAVAKNSGGEMIVVWTRDFPAVQLGSKVVAAFYQGDRWSDPIEITPDTDFNKDTAVVFDTNDHLMVAWSGASNEGLDYNQSPDETILNAIENADILYARLEGGTWRSSQPLAVLAGRDEQVSLASGPDGEITAVWLNHYQEKVTLYASRWDGTVWSSPVAVAVTADADAPAVTYVAGAPTLLWAQDGDNHTQTYDDWKLYTSAWNGVAWSAPQLIDIPTGASGELRNRNHIQDNRIGMWLPSYEWPPAKCCRKSICDPKVPPPGYDNQIQEIQPKVFIATDPNEKAASPQGEGTQHSIESGERLSYIVYFENKKDAAAPAQEVFIEDVLDASLDRSTLRVEAFAFGDVVVPNPQESFAFRDRITIADYRSEESKQWWVDMEAGFDTETGLLKFTFRTLDPETGDLPSDALAGFLPPEDGTGRGQGYVAFSVQTKKDLAPGTVIRNEASIVFDTNAPIVTNEVFHTIVGITKEIPLNGGWNLVSLPVSPSDKAVQEVLKSVESACTVVWSYQNTVWHGYSPKQSPTDLSEITEMDAGWGYWINMTAPDNLTVQGTASSEPITLKEGWNLVGFNGPQAMAIAVALEKIGDYAEVVWTYRDGKWLLYDPKQPLFSDLREMTPGAGYWIKVNSLCEWELPL